MDCAAEASHSARWVQFLRLPAPFGCGSESTVRCSVTSPPVLEGLPSAGCELLLNSAHVPLIFDVATG